MNTKRITNKRKVLFLIESLAGGGAEKVLTTLVKHIDPSKFDVSVCTVVDEGQYVNDVKSYVRYTSILPRFQSLSPIGKMWYCVMYKLIYNILPLSWVYRLFVPKDYDVEVAFIEGFATKLLSYSTNRKSYKIAWIHTDLEHNPWTRKLYNSLEEEKTVYKKYSAIACVSESAKVGFQHVFSSAMNLRVIYNPIETSNIKAMSEERKLIPHQKPLLVTVGRLEPQKGYDRLVRIVKNLVREQYLFELWILGVGSMERELKEYVDNNQLNDYVKFLGFHSNPYKYIVQGDLFVCSSRSEGYSTAVTEALILGVPVITTECSGMKELLKDGMYGVITDNDDEALCVGLKKLLKDNVLLSHYKVMAEKRGKAFTIESLMKPIEDLLME